MGTNISETTFRHNDDCLMSGCPGHKLRVEYQNTSDYYAVFVDNNLWFGGDPAQVGALIGLINGMRGSRVEIDSMMKQALPQEAGEAAAEGAA